jgi:hypothetical protein
MKSKFDLDNLPPDQTAIPGLCYYEELASRRLATAWTEVALWSRGSEPDDSGIQRIFSRKSLLIQPTDFKKAYSKLGSVGNCLRGLGEAQSGVYLGVTGYVPFHAFNFLSCFATEPLAFQRKLPEGDELFLNGDIKFNFSLKETSPGSGIWRDVSKSAEVVREVRTSSMLKIEIATAYLKRYLQVRQMALLVGHFSQRWKEAASHDELAAYKSGDLELGNFSHQAKVLIENHEPRKPDDSRLLRRLHFWFCEMPSPHTAPAAPEFFNLDRAPGVPEVRGHEGRPPFVR